MFKINKKGQKALNKSFAFLSIVSLVLQSLSGIFFLTPAYSQENPPSPTPTPTIEAAIVTSTPEITPTPVVEITAQPTPIATITPVVTAMPTVIPEEPKPNVLAASLPQEQSPPTTGDLLPSGIGQSSAQLNPSISTDKSDYTPNETAIISGKDLKPNTEYKIVITAENFVFEDKFTTTDKGTFLYSFPLGGTFRPNYKVEIKDSLGQVLASVTFTDSPTTNSSWPNCGFQCTAGDVNINKMFIGDALKNPITSTCNPGDPMTAYIWAEIYNNDNASRIAINLLGRIFVGNSTTPLVDFYSNNPAGYCSIDSIAGKATVVSSVYGPFSWTCGQRLEAKDLILSYETPGGGGGGTCATATYDCSARGTSKCWKTDSMVIEAPLVADFTFNDKCVNEAIQFTDKTTGGSLSYTYNWNFGDGGTSTLQNPTHPFSSYGTKTVSLTVTDSSGKTSTVTKTNIIVNNCSSSVTIKKVAHPQGSQLFTFSTDWGAPNFILDDNSDPAYSNSQTFNLGAGTYNVSETLPAGWNLSGISCTPSQPVVDNKVTITTNGNGLPVTCIFTNDLQLGTLLVHKTYTDNANFPVTIKVFKSTNLVDSKQTVNGDASFPLEVGKYSASVEVEPTGYHQQSNNCADKDIVAGQTTECTIVNTPDTGSLTLTKSSDNGINPADWKFNVSGSNGYSNSNVNSGTTLENLPLGTYTVTESGLTNYHFVSGSGTGCNFNQNGILTVTVANNGDAFSCTYKNAPDNGSISGTKFQDNDGDGFVGEVGESGLPGWTIEVKDLAGALVGSAITGTDGTYTVSNLVPGTYNVCELNQSPEWTRTYPGNDCYFGVEVGPGGQITGKDFGNFKNVDIKVCKTVDTNGDGVGEPYPAGWQMTLNKVGGLPDVQTTGEDGCYIWTNVEPGSYSVTEEEKTGWTPLGETTHNFNTVQSGAPYSYTFGNFENVSVTACKLADADGLLSTIGDRGYKEGWPVYLTIDSVRQTVQYTGTNGCYTWTDLGPGKVYAVEEDVTSGWTPLTSTTHSFGTPTSGNSTYSYNFINTALGTVIIEKQTDSDNDPTNFTFTGKVAGQIADNGQLKAENVLPGQFSVTETSLAGWDLTDLRCDDSDSYGNLSAKTATINLQAGETVKCTFTNTQRGHIIVTKDAVPNDAQDFSFENNFGNDNPRIFALDDDSTVTLPKTRSFEVIPGSGFRVSETVPDGWKQYSATCDGDGNTPDNITVAPGATITCTFVNHKLATITVVKNTIGGNDTFGYTTTGGSNFPANFDITTSGGTGSQTYNNIDPDLTYSVAETSVPDGWDKNGVTCENVTASGNPTSRDATGFKATNGGTVTCTFSNIKRGSVTGQKYNDVNGNGVKDGGDNGLLGWEIKLYDATGNTLLMGPTTTDTDGLYGFTNILPGDYRVCETNKDGWTNTDPNGGTNLTVCKSITVASGKETSADFGNFELGKISGNKFDDFNGNGYWDDNEIVLKGWTIKLEGPINLSTTTDTNGYYEFTGLTAGNYTLSETVDNTWTQTLIPPAFSIQSGSNYPDQNFGNFKNVDITVCKYIDANGDGDITNDSLYLKQGGWEVTLGDNESEYTDNGCYTYKNLGPGKYDLSESSLDGWTQTYPSSGTHKFNAQSGQDQTLNFGNYQYGQIKVCKYDDLNGDGKLNDEPAIAGVTMNLYKWEQNEQFSELSNELGSWVLKTSQPTEGNGCTLFDNLLYGNYRVGENVPTGYYQTYPLDPDYHEVPVQSGTDLTRDFLNAKYGSIGDTIYEDTNGNGTQDLGEPGISGVNVNLYQDNGNGIFEPGAGDTLISGPQATSVSGQYLFEGLVAGDYWVKVDGGLPDGLSLTTNNDPTLVHLTAGLVDLNVDFGYKPIPPSIEIKKTNNKSGGASAGDTITYTLTLTNGQIPLSNITVTDNLPLGFTYVSGSTAGASEPIVSGNNLKWAVDSLAGGAIATITYQAKIDSSQQAGIYYNFATCKATAREKQSINCNVDDSTVNIGQSFSFSTSISGSVLGVSTGEVLGAATGSETYWLVMAITMIMAGLFLVNRKRFIK